MNPNRSIMIIVGIITAVVGQPVLAQTIPNRPIETHGLEKTDQEINQYLKDLESLIKDEKAPEVVRDRAQLMFEEVKYDHDALYKRRALHSAFKDKKLSKQELQMELLIMSVEQLSQEVRMLRRGLGIDIDDLNR